MALTSADVIVNRVLIVDDDREETEFLSAFLTKKKLTIEVARDAGQAHAAFTMHHPDCVVVEILLPNEVSGFEVCERMKKSNDGVAVVMLTAIDMDDARDLARRVGADDYLTKPYDPDELLRRIRAAAERVWERKHLDDHIPKASTEKLRFMCGECGKHMKVSFEHRGRTLNCPKCGQPVVVPMHV